MKRETFNRYTGFMAVIMLALAFAGCGGGGSSTPVTTAPGAAPAMSAAEQAAYNVVENTPYLKSIDLSGPVQYKGKKASLAVSATRSATTVTRTLTGTDVIGDCCAIVYAEIKLTGTLTFNGADGTVVGTKAIDMFAYGTYELVKDAATGAWEIVKDPFNGMVFVQGNAPYVTDITTDPNGPYKPGDAFTINASVSPTSYGNELVISGQSLSHGLKVALSDDGVSPDTAADDFVYSGALTVPSTTSAGDEYVFVLDAMDATASFDLTESGVAEAPYVNPYSGAVFVTADELGTADTFTSAAITCLDAEIHIGGGTHCIVTGTLSDGTTKQVDEDDIQWTSGSNNAFITGGGIVLPSVFGELVVMAQIKGTSVTASTILTVTEASATTDTTTTTPATGVDNSAPTGVTAAAGDGQLTITWDTAADALSYNISIYAEGSPSGDLLWNVFPPYVVEGLTNGATYHIIVTTNRATGESMASEEVTAVPQAGIGSVPSAPLNVVATAGNGQATLTWDPVDGATYYNVYMAAATGVTKANYASLSGGMIHTSVTSPFAHTELNNSFTYYFVVTAGNAVGESAESSEVSAMPQSPPKTASKVDAGYHTCAALSDGAVKCWGFNSYGQLGNGTNTSSNVPVSVSGITSAASVAAGDYQTCALLSDGTIKCWGSNSNGQLGNGTNTSSNVPVTVSGITTATSVSAGNYHTCALLSDGSVKCWGYNGLGQLGNGTTTSSNVPVSVSGLTTATAVSAGNDQTCALLSDGTIKCWGNNYYGQLGNGTTTNSNVPVSVSGITAASAVSAGSFHTCAALSDGAVKCWGWNGHGQLGNGSTLNSNVPVTVSGITNASSVSAGNAHTCALLSDGSVKCWGNNSYGQLGNGTTTYSNVPVTVSGLTNATAVTAGYNYSCALLSDGAVKCWGYNVDGQLGDGTNTHSNAPVSVGSGLYAKGIYEKTLRFAHNVKKLLWWM